MSTLVQLTLFMTDNEHFGEQCCIPFLESNKCFFYGWIICWKL